MMTIGMSCGRPALAWIPGIVWLWHRLDAVAFNAAHAMRSSSSATRCCRTRRGFVAGSEAGSRGWRAARQRVLGPSAGEPF